MYSRADAVNEEDPERDRARRRRNGWAGGLFFESTSPFTLSVLCSIIFVKCVERSSIIFVIFDKNNKKLFLSSVLRARALFLSFLMILHSVMKLVSCHSDPFV